MPITIQCPECGKEFNVERKHVGRPAKCPCGTRFRVREDLLGDEVAADSWSQSGTKDVVKHESVPSSHSVLDAYSSRDAKTKEFEFEGTGIQVTKSGFWHIYSTSQIERLVSWVSNGAINSIPEWRTRILLSCAVAAVWFPVMFILTYLFGLGDEDGNIILDPFDALGSFGYALSLTVFFMIFAGPLLCNRRLSIVLEVDGCESQDVVWRNRISLRLWQIESFVLDDETQKPGPFLDAVVPSVGMGLGTGALVTIGGIFVFRSSAFFSIVIGIAIGAFAFVISLIFVRSMMVDQGSEPKLCARLRDGTQVSLVNHPFRFCTTEALGMVCRTLNERLAELSSRT